MAQSVGASERNSVVVGSDPTQAKESFSSEYHIYIIFIYIYNIYIYSILFIFLMQEPYFRMKYRLDLCCNFKPIVKLFTYLKEKLQTRKTIP